MSSSLWHLLLIGLERTSCSRTRSRERALGTHRWCTQRTPAMVRAMPAPVRTSCTRRTWLERAPGTCRRCTRGTPATSWAWPCPESTSCSCRTWPGPAPETCRQRKRCRVLEPTTYRTVPSQFLVNSRFTDGCHFFFTSSIIPGRRSRAAEQSCSMFLF